jgi:hypothetical protein
MDDTMTEAMWTVTHHGGGSAMVADPLRLRAGVVASAILALSLVIGGCAWDLFGLDMRRYQPEQPTMGIPVMSAGDSR